MIEDSVAGIAGAIAAGMPVLGFHGGSHCRPGYGDGLRAAGAAATFDDMRQLPGLIERIGGCDRNVGQGREALCVAPMDSVI